MALLHSMEEEGKWLFKYRGQIPVLLFVLAVPVIYFTDYASIPNLWQDVILIISVAISVIGFFIRAIAVATTPKGTSGRNTKEQVAESLNHTGIYSTVRHPLYVGNYLMWIGIVCYTMNIWYVLTVTLAYWLYYERIMFAEERFLERKFGDDYVNWSMKVPAFIPSFRNYIKGAIPFSLKTVLRREYSGVLATVIGFVFIDVLRDWLAGKEWSLDRTHWYVLGITLLVTLTIRTIKKTSRVLHEDGRS